MNFSSKDFFSKCDKIRSFLQFVQCMLVRPLSNQRSKDTEIIQLTQLTGFFINTKMILKSLKQFSVMNKAYVKYH